MSAVFESVSRRLATKSRSTFRAALIGLEGQRLTRSGILFTGSDDMDDPELRALVELESRELLSEFGLSELEVIGIPDPRAGIALRALLDAPARATNVRRATPRNEVR
jgi:hypothetical protein